MQSKCSVAHLPLRRSEGEAVNGQKHLIIGAISFPPQHASYYGSLLQASTVSLGTGPSGEVYVPFRDLLPMVHPNNIVFDGRCFACMEGEVEQGGGHGWDAGGGVCGSCSSALIGRLTVQSRAARR